MEMVFEYTFVQLMKKIRCKGFEDIVEMKIFLERIGKCMYAQFVKSFVEICV